MIAVIHLLKRDVPRPDYLGYMLHAHFYRERLVQKVNIKVPG